MTTPLFNWLKKRSVGVLLHPTSLPGEFGIGTLGKEARAFVDSLAELGMGCWQICPLGPTGYGDSPYQAFSAFALNPYLIDVQSLVQAGLLQENQLGPLLFLSSEHVDYGGIYKLKWPVLRQAYQNYKHNRHRPLPYGDFLEFQQRHRDWLEPYTVFQGLKAHFGGAAWTEWPASCGNFAKARKSSVIKKIAEEIEAQAFYQYLAYGQWSALKNYANQKGIEIIGDMPLYVAFDSADFWSNPDQFQFEAKTRQPIAVAGCPPDYFSADGQYWGNPLYDWDYARKNGFRWWIRRFELNFSLFDVVRVDHFRGFDTYWSVPWGSPTAASGEWIDGPGLGLFSALKNKFPDARIIAEDLGDLFPSVLKLRDDSGLPGMAVLQFAFGGKADNLYLPHNHIANQVLYPGTHDNNTTLGWYRSADSQTQDHVRRYFRINGDEIAWDFIRTSYESVCNLVVIPLQDFLSLDASARFNSPGTAEGNWAWRFRADQLQKLCANSGAYLRDLAELYGREGVPTENPASADEK